jgi:hypothetical protein
MRLYKAIRTLAHQDGARLGGSFQPGADGHCHTHGCLFPVLAFASAGDDHLIGVDAHTHLEPGRLSSIVLVQQSVEGALHRERR